MSRIPQACLHGILILEGAKRPVNEYTLKCVLSAAQITVDDSLLIRIVSAYNTPDRTKEKSVKRLKDEGERLGLENLFK